VQYIQALQQEMQRQQIGALATVMGRYYGMDRDQRWDRTAQAYAAMAEGQGRYADDAVAAIERSYSEDTSDEFVVPVVLCQSNGTPVGPVQSGDTVVCFNFRADRVRQMTRALTEPHFSAFPRRQPPAVHYVCLTPYSAEFDVPVAFSPQPPTHILAEVFTTTGMRNVRIAETEKYAHVTYFFNGGTEKAFPYEERILIPSAKVATYDLQPTMSAVEITTATLEQLHNHPNGVYILNFANADMVGHTGNFDATVQAIETLDSCVGRLIDAVEAANGQAIITADHGNAEHMFDPLTNSPHTAHTTNPVPFILFDKTFRGTLRSGGALCDVAPTLLAAMGLPQPAAMTGTDLRLPA
jgi:2,3-bisphosphoglycerate-independent phosphoglycerate mutase